MMHAIIPLCSSSFESVNDEEFPEFCRSTAGDDDPSIILVFSAIFEDLGVRVGVVRDGSLGVVETGNVSFSTEGFLSNLFTGFNDGGGGRGGVADFFCRTGL